MHVSDVWARERVQETKKKFVLLLLSPPVRMSYNFFG